MNLCLCFCNTIIWPTVVANSSHGELSVSRWNEAQLFLHLLLTPVGISKDVKSELDWVECISLHSFTVFHSSSWENEHLYLYSLNLHVLIHWIPSLNGIFFPSVFDFACVKPRFCGRCCKSWNLSVILSLKLFSSVGCSAWSLDTGPLNICFHAFWHFVPHVQSHDLSRVMYDLVLGICGQWLLTTAVTTAVILVTTAVATDRQWQSSCFGQSTNLTRQQDVLTCSTSCCYTRMQEVHCQLHSRMQCNSNSCSVLTVLARGRKLQHTPHTTSA